MAIQRMLLLYGVTFAIGGIPLLYSSDELGLLNDYSYRDDEAKRHDDRWVNRIAVTQAQIDNVLIQDEPAKNITAQCQRRVFNGLRDMLNVRRTHRVFGNASTSILDTGNPHCFAFIRRNDAGEKLLVICNFSEQHQVVDGLVLQALEQKPARDLLNDETLSGKEQSLSVAPYQQCWWFAQ